MTDVNHREGPPSPSPFRVAGQPVDQTKAGMKQAERVMLYLEGRQGDRDRGAKVGGQARSPGLT